MAEPRLPVAPQWQPNGRPQDGFDILRHLRQLLAGIELDHCHSDPAVDVGARTELNPEPNVAGVRLHDVEVYAEITGGVAKGDEHWALAAGPNGDIGFQQIDDYRPPTWPDGDVGMQMHLDFFVDDLDATEARVLAAGATRFEHQPNADHCLVYADPAGHPFYLSMWAAPRLGD